MGGRHEAREWAVQFLFQRDFNKGELEAALAVFWMDRKTTPKDKAFTEELIRGVEDNRTELDKKIQQYAENWDVKRMGAVDRNIIRLALYEMLHRPDVPPVVSINEGVEIAKEFSGLESGKFVNGILDRACRDLQRPTRAAMNDKERPAGKEKSSG